VIQTAKQMPFLRSVNQSGGIAFNKPGDIYLRGDDLAYYFSENPDIWFLDETEGEPEWLEFGVSRKPRFRKVQVDLAWEEKDRLRGNQGHTRDIETIDYNLDGLDNYLSRLPKDSQQLKRHSLIIWDFLLEHLKESSHYQFYEGKYKWFYYQKRTAYFAATWKKQIRFCSWIPKDGIDNPFKPDEISLGDLPDQFDRNEKLADLLGMKKDVFFKLAEESGIPMEDIDLLRRYPEEFSRWKTQIAEQKPAFAEKASLNVGRRKEKITEKYHKAPKKKYEKKNYSKKTTENSIDPKTWLRGTYTNEKGKLICQICQEKMPFKKRNGCYYFEAIELLNDIDREMEELHIALCPLCAAMYNEFIKRDENAMVNIKKALMNSEGLYVPLRLGELDTSIRFVETHYHDIKTIIEVQE